MEVAKILYNSPGYGVDLETVKKSLIGFSRKIKVEFEEVCGCL
jgi:hypothetical protein